jgi:hypothetical protein
MFVNLAIMKTVFRPFFIIPGSCSLPSRERERALRARPQENDQQIWRSNSKLGNVGDDVTLMTLHF